MPSTLPHQILRLQVLVVLSFIYSLKETKRGFFPLACDNATQQESQEKAKYLLIMLQKDLKFVRFLKSALVTDKHSLVDMPSIP